MKKLKLDKEETELLNSFESGDFRSVSIRTKVLESNGSELNQQGFQKGDALHLMTSSTYTNKSMRQDWKTTFPLSKAPAVTFMPAFLERNVLLLPVFTAALV